MLHMSASFQTAGGKKKKEKESQLVEGGKTRGIKERSSDVRVAWTRFSRTPGRSMNTGTVVCGHSPELLLKTERLCLSRSTFFFHAGPYMFSDFPGFSQKAAAVALHL